MAEADAAGPPPRLRRLSSSDAVDELLEHSQLGPIYKAHQDEGWYLHQPAGCGKVVTTWWDVAVETATEAATALVKINEGSMCIRPTSKNAEPSCASRRQMVCSLFAVSFLPANGLTRAMFLVRGYGPAPTPVAATPAAATGSSAGFVERLMYNSLASGVRAGRINFTLNGRIPTIDEARRLVARARERGIIRE